MRRKKLSRGDTKVYHDSHEFKASITLPNDAFVKKSNELGLTVDHKKQHL